MIQKKFYSAFTLVELIVVITILAILWTTAFISLWGYAVIARETARLTDINVISRALNISYTENGFYPETASGASVTFSGTTLWTQWYFTEEVRSKLWRISETPVDVLVGSPYVYSVTYNRQEYQLWGGGEKWNPIASLNFIPQTSAFFSKAIVKWNYNWVILGIEIDDLVYIFWVPSIITQSTGWLDIESVYANKLYVLDNFSALPINFATTPEEQTRQIDFTLQNIDDYILYVGTKEDISTWSWILSLSQNLYTLYDDTVLENQPNIITLVDSTLTIPEEETTRVSLTAQHLLAVESVRNIVPVSWLQNLVQTSWNDPIIQQVNNFNFSNLSNQEVDLEVYSQTLTVSWIDTPINLSISWDWDPAMQIDGGDWETSGMIASWQTIRIRMNTSAIPEQSRSVNFTYGWETITWSTSTRNYAACPIGEQSYVYNIPDADMQNGASYNGKWQCSATWSLIEWYWMFWKEDANGTWNRVGYDATPSNIGECAGHSGRLSYTTGPRAWEYDLCMCTIFIQCTSSWATPVWHTW